jgi:Uncharacterized protein conserved in bacteria
MNRFLGNIDAKTDMKGRVFIPASFRKVLMSAGETRLILKKDIYQECLILYPESIWNEELSNLRSRLNKWDPEQQQLFRQFVMDAELIEPDASGRILIPKRYLQLAGITSEVRFLGMDYTMEIWAREKLEKPLLDTDAFIKAMQKHLTNE